MHKFSLIIPIYNLELNHIKECIDSIKAQDYLNWECIIIDDCSNEKYYYNSYWDELLKDKRFFYIRNKENYGLPISRNIGFFKSTGDLIWFIDGDDLLCNDNALSYLNEIFNKYNDIDFINFSYLENLYKKDSEKIVIEHINRINGVINNEYKNVDINYIKGWHSVWRNVYRKKFLEKYNITFQNKKVVYEDFYWDLLTFTYSKKYYLCDKIFYSYKRNRKGSIVNKRIKINDKLNIFINNLMESIDVIRNLNKDIYVFYLFYYYQYFPFLNKSIRTDIRNIYNKYKNEFEISFFMKISMIISKSSFLCFLYKPTLKTIIFFKKILILIYKKLNNLI